jgi:hypothetical protein
VTRLEDLPERDRKAVERAIGRKSSTKERTRTRPSRAEVKLAPGEVERGGSCSCGETFGTYKAWEKHRDNYPTPSHGRYSIDLYAPAAK